MLKLGLQFQQGHQNKIPPDKVRMGNYQKAEHKDVVFVKEYVYVYLPWSPPFPLLPAHQFFYFF
jgi:hypothetical protein